MFDVEMWRQFDIQFNDLEKMLRTVAIYVHACMANVLCQHIRLPYLIWYLHMICTNI